MSILERRLVGFLWRCGNPQCNCVQPVIQEHTINSDGELVKEEFWEGDFMPDPGSTGEQYLLNELAEQCYRHKMEEDPFEPGVWERDI